MKAATHNGGFHADDVFAIAILKLIYPDIEVIRTRDSKSLELADVRVDVGGTFNPDTGDFDHHQKSFNEKRENSTPYASAGLIWKYYGSKLASKEARDYIDDNIIQFIDADDTGIDVLKADIPVYTLADFVKHWNPIGSERSNDNFDKRFEEIVLIVMKLMQIEIKRAEEEIISRKIVRQKIKESDKKYIVLEEPISWKETVVRESDLKFVIVHNPAEKQWAAIAVPKVLGSFENRASFPKKWGGLYNEELAKITRVRDTVFCHKKLFIAVTKTRDGAIKLVELALKNEK